MAETERADLRVTGYSLNSSLDGIDEVHSYLIAGVLAIEAGRVGEIGGGASAKPDGLVHGRSLSRANGASSRVEVWRVSDRSGR